MPFAAVRAGADYVAFGSVFASPTKPAALRAPLSLFAPNLGVPKAAIGGITLENAGQVLAAGADLLAVISDLFDAPDVARRRPSLPATSPTRQHGTAWKRRMRRPTRSI